MLNQKKEFDIPKGWNALYNPVEKKVYVMREFPHGGKANSILTLLSKPTKEELIQSFTDLGLTWTEPAV